MQRIGQRFEQSCSLNCSRKSSFWKSTEQCYFGEDDDDDHDNDSEDDDFTGSITGLSLVKIH